MAYYILTEFYVNLANEGHLAPLKAIWMPLIIFLPISIFLTSKAARDSSIFDATSYYSFINKFFQRKIVFKILQISNKAPYPANDGSSIAIFNMAKGLIENNVELHLLTINTKTFQARR